MSAAEFLDEHGNALSRRTPYERHYVERVLNRVPDLNWKALSAQTPFSDAHGRTRYIDFTIIEGDVVRIAIEVDGYDKTGEGRGMTREEFADWSRREQAITAAGYRVVRVANRLIDREPDLCARTVELVLRRERALQEQLAAIPAAQRPDTDEARRLFASQLLDADELAELRGLYAIHTRAIEQMKADLTSEIERREAAERARDDARDDRRGVLGIARVLAGTVALAVAALVAVVVATHAGNEAEPNARAVCARARDWSDAAALTGRRATLKGPVVAATYRSRASGGPTFIDVGARYPDTKRLQVVVWERNRDGFAKPPETAYQGHTVAVTGTIARYAGVAQIEADSAATLIVC